MFWGLLAVWVGGGFPLAGKGFASPTQFKGEDIKNALIRNWRNLTTYINTWVVKYDANGIDLELAGDLTVAGNIGVNGQVAQRPEITGGA